jgi:hypothetical protein
MNEEKDIFDFIEKRKVDMPDKAYFDKLAQGVIDSQKTKIIPLYKRPITWIGAAAAAIVLVLLVTKFNISGQDPNPAPSLSNQFNDISKEELLAYVDENIDEFDIELISEFVPTDELNAKYEALENRMSEELEVHPLETITLENITKEEILEYLNDEDFDFSDLEDEDSFI